ncbi:MAG: hypothetical protein Q9P90_16190 [candidate division KSB1 bacterium]|nr:hypothetical protein [candidate division KSB1 bacterium]
MKTIRLWDIAYARSGDKGDASNVGIVAYDERGYAFLREVLTPERVKAHFKEICRGSVDRYELPNLKALNFILHDSLGGGGSESLKTDAQGKTHGLGLLYMKVEAPDDLPVYPRR